jgi:uncharacterized protein HemX
MVNLFKRIQESYREQSSWSKMLYFFPMLLLIIVYSLYVAFGKSKNKKYNNLTKQYKKKIDGLIEVNKKQIEDLHNLQDQAEAKLENKEKEIRAKDEEAKQIYEDINNAVSDNDIDKLSRIHKRINRKSKGRETR